MKWAFWIFTALYLVALLIFAVGAIGLFGQNRDPLSGVFLIPLGLPWSLAAARMDSPSLLILIALPLINVAILYWLWKRRGRTG